MKKWIFVFFCLKALSALAADSFLDLNDVSILLPLPDAQNWSQLWNGETVGAKGELLPFKSLDGVPRLIAQITNANLYPDIKVVGMRLDPCFHEGATSAPCRPQVRLVWQPLKLENGATSTYDTSLHSFYDLTTDDFKHLLNEVIALKKTKTDQNNFLPLGVNPFIKQEGLNGNYIASLRTIILKYIGEKNLTRITFMQLFMTEKTWMFGGFDIIGGESVPMRVPRTDNSTFQIFSNAVPIDRPFWFLGGMKPAPAADLENLGLLIADSRALAPQNEDEISAAVKAAFRFENPDMNNPGTVDCVSCHVAQPARSWALRQYPWLQLDVVYKDQIYSSERDLRNLSPMQPHTNVLRSFGYFTNRPITAQRTINESAAVIKYLNENF